MGLTSAQIKHQVQGADPARMDQERAQLIGDALGANHRQGGCHRLNGGGGSGLDGQVETRGQAHGPQQSQLVFHEPLAGLTDGAEYARLEVCPATDVIHQGVLKWIEKHAVDREVATQGVLPTRGKHHGIGMPAIAIGDIAAKGRDFHLQEAFFLARPEHFDDAEAGPDRDGLAK